MADPRKPGKRETDALKMAGEIRLREIAARRLKLEKQYQRLQQGEIKNAKELEKLHKEALHLSDLEVESRGKLSKIQDTIVSQFKSDTYDRVIGFLKKEVSVAHQLDFVWERVRHGAELYAKVQGSLPALTGKQQSEIEKLNKKISEGGLSAKTALEIFEKMPDILDDAKNAAKSLAYQQFLMAEAARDTALRYGRTYDEVRKLQKTVQETLAIRVVDKGTRKDIEQVTDSLLYMETRGIMPVADALKNTTKLSKQFGFGTTAAVVDSAKVFEKLARIPDYLSDRMKKAEGVVGHFDATNREDFLRTVLELNNAYGTQSTILKNVGATFAHLTLEARKYGAEAQAASNVSKGLSSALLDNTKDTHITFLAGQKLAEELQSQPGAFEEMTAGMTDEMKKNIQRMVEEGGIAYSDLANALASTSKGMEARLGVIRNIYSGRGLGVISRLLPSIPGLENLKGPEEKYTAARMLTEGASAKEIIAAVNNLQKTSEKGNNERRKAEGKTLTATNTIAEPLRAAETMWQGTKEIAFRGAAEALGKDSEDNIRKVAMGTTVIAGGVMALNKVAGNIFSWLSKGKGGAEATAKAVGAEGKVAATTARALEKSRELLSAESKVGQALSKMKGGKESLNVLSKIPGGAKLAEMLTGGGKVGAQLTKAMASGPGKLLQKGASILGPAMFGYDAISGGMGEAAMQAYKSMFEGKNMDWDKLASNVGEGGLKSLTSGGFLMEPGAWVARNITAPATGMKPEEAEQLFREYTSVSKWMEGMSGLGSNVYDWTHGETPKMNQRGIQPESPTIVRTQAKDMQLNPDGSATVRTVLELNQKVNGFSSAAVGAVEQAKANRRYGS